MKITKNIETMNNLKRLKGKRTEKQIKDTDN